MSAATKRHRHTAAQRRVLLQVAKGKVVRRRGAYGEYQADQGAEGWAASITIDILWRRGYLEPAEGFGAYRAGPAASRWILRHQAGAVGP